MTQRKRLTPGFVPLALVGGLALLPTAAHAGDGEASASVSLDGAEAKADGSADAEVHDPKRKHIPWIKRWAPEDRMSEIGIFGGVALIADDHELYQFDADLSPNGGWKSVNGVQPDIGARLGFYPIRHFGVEAEFAAIPMASSEFDKRAFGFAIRGSLIGQVGLWSVTPFVTVGAGTLAVTSPRSRLGGDQDEVFHVGAGAKFFLSRYVGLRFDFRNLFTSNFGPDNKGGTSHQELLFGLAITLGRDKNEAPPAPADGDGDGVTDDVDKCPEEAGVPEYDGCPVPDTDGDGVKDDVDKCVDEAGSPDYEGCPVPDSDGDGFADDVDKCPQDAGVEAYEGCPIPDTDGDGIFDDADKCVDEKETDNGFQDEDGCPDEIPEAVASFVGVIEGIYFDTGKSTIRKSSRKTLDKAVEILKEYDYLRLEVSGHTDNKGDHDDNIDLSKARADSVRQYMVDAGIAGDRLETVGYGPDKPVESNDTKDGRQKNRRIEFRLLKKEEHAGATVHAADAKAEGEAKAEGDAKAEEPAKTEAKSE